MFKHIFVICLYLAFSIYGYQDKDFRNVRNCGILNHAPVQSSAKETSQCPSGEDIFPCVCIPTSQGLWIDCSSVTTTQMLYDIFHKPFLNNTLYKFSMNQAGSDAEVDELKYGIFGDKTFETVFLTCLKFIFNEDIFDDMKDTLTSLGFNEVSLNTFKKDFTGFNKLSLLSFYGTGLNDVWVSSDTLEDLSVQGAHITEQEDGVPFNPGPMKNLERLELIDVGLKTLPDSSTYPKLRQLFYVFNNKISSIEVKYSTRSYLITFSAMSDCISKIEVDSIRVAENARVSLDANQLTRLDEEIFGNIFINASDVWLVDNPLECGCDLAWIIRNQTYVNKLEGGETCANGTKLTDLNPGGFDGC